MKKTAVNFFLCNLTALGAGLVCELLFLGSVSFFVQSTFVYYFLRSVCIAASLPFCLYFICFEKNNQFKGFYVTYKNELLDSADIGKNLFRKNTKFLAIILLISVAVLTAMPKQWSTHSADLANTLSLYDDLSIHSFHHRRCLWNICRIYFSEKIRGYCVSVVHFSGLSILCLHIGLLRKPH